MRAPGSYEIGIVVARSVEATWRNVTGTALVDCGFCFHRNVLLWRSQLLLLSKHRVALSQWKYCNASCSGYCVP